MTAAAILAAAAPAHAAAPVVEEMVVGKSGSAKIRTVRASSTRVKIRGKRCAVGAGTPLAALVRGKVGTLRFADYGSCGRRARDAGSLYVRGIGRDVADPGDPDGWVYKVGNKAAPAGAADPSGPFGRGLLKTGQRVLWFWCVADESGDGCQRTLALKVTSAAPGAVTVHVRGYDNPGKAVDVEAAIVSAGDRVAITDEAGNATLDLPAGDHEIIARKDGLVRSFPEEVRVP